tara:strand:+ start:189 stop:428 length:240 start_codon:yes stop_codon:yes gene_type:complete
MDSREINYKTLLDNVVGMIGLLEYDSMRSAGKCKLNSNNLVSLYSLKDRYESKLVSVVEPTPMAKPTTQKVAAKKAVAK